jgi:xanthine dehydrogenase iron-sulfur cluster and FAD-binding subunit A
MWQKYISVHSVDQALRSLADEGPHARIVAGATDLILELENGLRPEVDTLIDISRVPALDRLFLDNEGWIHLGSLVTHNHCAGSKLLQERAFALARACWEVGAPQIRNRGTVAGNLITGSPANDSIAPLMALGARITLRNVNGERIIALSEFYKGVRKTVMREDEMLIDIAFPAPPEGTNSAFIKFALRRAQAISVVNAAVVLRMNGHSVQKASIALGSVAPTIIRVPEAEAYLAGKQLEADVITEAGAMAARAANPIDDLRASARYRREMVRLCTERALRQLASKHERDGFPDHPVMLWGKGEKNWEGALSKAVEHQSNNPIETRINGRNYTFTTGQDKTLLRLIREEAGLTGTKEGCAEGECGACTVFLDGMAVMSCLVPAPRAHHAEIITIEGLASDGHLHSIQEAFIEKGAVQCGYCTPGFLMSGAKLLEERPSPTHWEIQQSITGNLCRCTGYYKIISAFERAAELHSRKEV